MGWWKVPFDPDLNKEAQEGIFYRILSKSCQTKIFFNNVPVFSANWQKH